MNCDLAVRRTARKTLAYDQFFRSLADQHGNGFAVVLTGAGSDGALGAKAIKEAGGVILVQSG